MAKLPILMYHDVSGDVAKGKGLTIAADVLESHFAYLSKNGYTTLHFEQLQNYNEKNTLPKKAVMITFDDVYVSQLQLAYPLLERYGLKATFFIPFEYVGELDAWNTNSKAIMTREQLASMDPSVVELGLHSFHHGNYVNMGIGEVEADFEKCKDFVKLSGLPVNNILAYPYGKFPKKEPAKTEFFECLHKHKMAYGLRIGNRVNHFPFKNNYEVQRIDIKGEDTLLKFKLKLRLGKLKLF